MNVAPGKGSIDVRDLNVTYSGKRAICAVDKLNFKVNPREFVCILGSSGCGKSTVLNALAGFIRPTSGEVTLDGRSITAPHPERGVVFQTPTLFKWKTVKENIEFGLKMKGVCKTERMNISDTYVETMGLKGFENCYPDELSGGMEQRVEIARVLASDPLVMLMDEPFGSLDAHTRIMMQEMLLKIWEERQKTVVFVTHDIDEAIILADRILVMSARPGRIKEEIQIKLPRPRSYDIVLSKPFISIKKRAMGLIREETTRTAVYESRMPEREIEKLRARQKLVYETLKSIKEKRGIDVLGKHFFILPGVFAPLWEDSRLLAKTVSRETKRGDFVLDMGTGTGIQGIFAAEKASKVISVDVNPAAVECAKLNAKHYGLEDKMVVFESDLFSNVDAKFDTIIFNPPFRWFKPRDTLERGSLDENYKGLNGFLSKAGDHLNEKGRIILAFSSTGDIKHLEHLINVHRYESRVLAKRNRDGWDYAVYGLTLPDSTRAFKNTQKTTGSCRSRSS